MAPVFIKQNGRTVAVMLDIDEFSRLQRLADLAEDYRDIIAGLESPTIPQDEVHSEVDAMIESAFAGDHDPSLRSG